MKSLILLFSFFLCISLLSCSTSDDPVSYEYHAHIMQPSSADKHLGDIMFIRVEFESHTGESIEHIKIRLYNKDTQLEVYNEPDDPHIGGPADYEFEDEFVLSGANTVTTGNWVLEATVWGMDEGQDQVKETVEFEIIP
jgi:hypothetical protein